MMKKWEWYWIQRMGRWVHGGACLLAAKLQGYECEPERRPGRWRHTMQCVVCGKITWPK